jgi:uroporphyrin-3 C-methyltransferase
MNETDKQENDAAELEAELEAEAEPSVEEVSDEPVAEEPVEPSPPAAKKSGGSFLAFLALLLAGAALGASYYLWQQLEQVRRDGESIRSSLRQEMSSSQSPELPGQVSALQAQLSELRAELSPLQAQMATLGQEPQQQPGQGPGISTGALDALQRQISEIREQISSQAVGPTSGPAPGPTASPITTPVAGSPAAGSETVWMVAELEYLLQAANRRLQLEQDLQTAVTALQAADKRLQENADPRWTGVREQLAAEIAALRAVPAVDRNGLSLRIATLIEQVATIDPVMVTTATAAAEEQQETAPATPRDERSLETLPGDLWQYLRSQVDIRHRDRKLPIYLPPDQLYYLKQNLQLQLEGARFAVLRSDQQLYAESLERANGWLGEYFDQEQDAVKVLLAEIGQLKQETIQPQLPDISGSLRALRAQTGGSEEAEQP